MSAHTVTEELKASLRASMEQHRAFPAQENRVLDRINVLLGMVSTLQSLAQAVGDHTGLGMEMLQFGTAISTQAQEMSAIVERMRTNFASINAKPLKSRLDDLQRAPGGVKIPGHYATQTALDLVTELNNLHNQLTTLELGSMAYEQQLNQYAEEAYPGTERRF